MQSDGIQYECYKSKGVTTSNYSSASSSSYHWTRSVHPSNFASFRCVHSNGSYDYTADAELMAVCDGVMLDVKAWDDGLHRKLTGMGSQMVISSSHASHNPRQRCGSRGQ